MRRRSGRGVSPAQAVIKAEEPKETAQHAGKAKLAAKKRGRSKKVDAADIKTFFSVKDTKPSACPESPIPGEVADEGLSLTRHAEGSQPGEFAIKQENNCDPEPACDNNNSDKTVRNWETEGLNCDMSDSKPQSAVKKEGNESSVIVSSQSVTEVVSQESALSVSNVKREHEILPNDVVIKQEPETEKQETLKSTEVTVNETEQQMDTSGGDDDESKPETSQIKVYETLTNEITASDGTLPNEITASEGRLTNEITPSDGTLTNEITASDGTLTNEITASDGTLTNEITASDGTLTNEITASDGTLTNEITASDGTLTNEITASGIITNEMIEEEKNLHEESVKQEEKLKEQQTEMMKGMTEDVRAERYKRLEYLLSKSNLYTQYLIERMERQKQEAQKRKERALKKRATMEKKKEEEMLKNQVKAEIGGNEHTGNSAEGKIETRHRKREGLSDSQESSQDSQSSMGYRKDKKRKLNKVAESQYPEKPSAKKQKFPYTDKEVDKENVADNKSLDKPESTSETLPENMVDMSTSIKENPDNCVSPLADNSLDDEAELTGRQRFINGELVPPEQPILFTGGVLRSYQIDGYKWLSTLYENGVNGILGDEMGLGKTIQCIALVAHMMSMGVCGPYLVVGPLSTLPNWHSEFQRFTPKAPVILYHGSKDARSILRKKIRRLVPVRKNVKTLPCVITSYEIAMIDRKFLQNYEWKYLIVDEGHRIKNTHCRLINELKMYKTTHRLLLTGTPLQNNLAELWSLLNFLLPEIFDDLGSFEAWFDVEFITEKGSDEKLAADCQRQQVLSMLHQILTPFLLRRLKSDVDLCIPPKREVLVYAPLTEGQQEYYSAVVNRTVLQMIENKKVIKEPVEVSAQGRPVRRASKKKINYELFISNKDDEEEKPKKHKKGDDTDGDDDELDEWVKAVMDYQNNRVQKEEKKTAYSSQVTIKMANIMMQLRKCCNHPYLLEYPLDEDGEYLVNEKLIHNSGKMLLLDRMLSELKRRGHKVLLFSQMTKMLDIVEDYCLYKKVKYCRLDGSCGVDNRREQIQKFNTDPEVFVFLLSTRAGGLGLNLVAADTVIIYDSDWNPQSDLQAQDRCHRIGQTRPVVVYRMVTANTIDQRIVERAAAKRKLEKMVIHKGKFKTGMNNFSTSLVPISPEELLTLLNSSDHQGIVKGKEGNVISDSELKALLDRSELEGIWQRQKQIIMKVSNNVSCKADVNPGTAESYTATADGGSLFKVIDTDPGRVGFGSSAETTTSVHQPSEDVTNIKTET